VWRSSNSLLNQAGVGVPVSKFADAATAAGNTMPKTGTLS
jgi:hypothetical protein